MKKITEKSIIKKALGNLSKGNISELKKLIQDAILLKVRKRIDEKEKELSKKILNKPNKDK